jgi:resuscitation-promoting factor RpfB
MAQPLPPPPDAPEPTSKPVWKRWWVWAIVVVVVLIAGAALSDVEEDTDGAASTPTAVPEPTIGATTSPEPSLGIVPSVQGDYVVDAVEALESAGFTAVVDTKRTSTQPRETVLRQSPPPATEVELGSTINLVVAMPLPVIPNVVNDKLMAARRTLQQRGFEVTVRKESSSQPKDTVLRQSPEAGTSARPGRVVRLVVAKPPPPSGGGGGNGTSGYSPCLPPASDYDCAGGTGDGPAYTEPGVVYTVSGSDPYGLDADNDGDGCE